MKRRDFLKKLTAFSVGAAALTTPSLVRAQKKKKVRWRLALAVPKTLPLWGPGIERFAKNVETLTGGGLRIKVYGAGELVPALGTFDAVRTGQIQMGHACAYYWQGKLPAAPFFGSIPFGMGSDAMNAWLLTGGGQELWDEMMAPHGVISLPCGNPGYQTTGWFNKEITSVDSLKGLKIRIPGLAAKVYAKAGASPVLLPAGDLFTSLATGVIDAVEWAGPYQDYVLGLHKAAKFFYSSSWHEPGTVLELMINRAAWNTLPEEYQTAVRVAAAETDRYIHLNWNAKNGEYLNKIKAEGKVQLREMPVDVLRALKKYSEEAVDEMVKTSPLAKKVYESFTSFRAEYEGYKDWSERSYYKAFKNV